MICLVKKKAISLSSPNKRLWKKKLVKKPVEMVLPRLMPLQTFREKNPLHHKLKMKNMKQSFWDHHLGQNLCCIVFTSVKARAAEVFLPLNKTVWRRDRMIGFIIIGSMRTWHSAAKQVTTGYFMRKGRECSASFVGSKMSLTQKTKVKSLIWNQQYASRKRQ